MARSYKKRKVKTKFKFTKPFIFLLLFFVVIIVLTGLFGIRSEKSKLYSKISKAETAASVSNGVSEDNVFREISYKGLVNKIDKSSYTYVYYGVMTSADYLNNLETVNKRAKSYDIKTVYLFDSMFSTYLDIEDEDDGEENNVILTALQKSLGEVDLKTNNQIWVFKSGELVFNSKDYTNDTYQASKFNYVLEQAFGNYNNKK